MRADVYLVEYKYADSRAKAQRLIKSGCVSIDGRKTEKASEEVDENSAHSVDIAESEDERYVSRGGLKLEAALDEFKIDVKNAVCADIGASTGGFTDCLLQRGAKKVYAFDSGKDQLHKKLRQDGRVISKESFNARYITLADIGEKADIVVMDVSFISQTLLIPSLTELMAEGGILVSLIKPQFEAGRAALGKNGIVKNKADRLAAIKRVEECAAACGLSCRGIITSPIKGGDGNEEYLGAFERKHIKII